MPLKYATFSTAAIHKRPEETKPNNEFVPPTGQLLSLSPTFTLLIRINYTARVHLHD